jgi:hypothetical protein
MERTSQSLPAKQLWKRFKKKCKTKINAEIKTKEGSGRGGDKRSRGYE